MTILTLSFLKNCVRSDLTWLHWDWLGGLHYFEDGTRRVGLVRGGAKASGRRYGVMGGGGTGGAVGDLQGRGGSDRGCVDMGVQREGGLGGDTRGRGHCQCGHRPALLACCLTHNDLDHAGAAHQRGGCWGGKADEL